MAVTKPYKSIGFGDINGPNPYKFTGHRWAPISQTPVTGLATLVLAVAGLGARIFSKRFISFYLVLMCLNLALSGL